MNCNDVPPKSVVLQGWGWAGYNMRMNINIWSISSWWLSHPFEKYARQIGSSPQGPKLKNSWSHHLLSDTLNGFRNPAPIWHAMKTHTVDGRNPAPVEVGSLSHSLQGFIHPRWCRISSINSNSEIKYQTLLVLGVGFLKLQVAFLAINYFLDLQRQCWCFRNPKQQPFGCTKPPGMYLKPGK